MDNLRHELQVQQLKWNLFWGINAHDSSKSEDKKNYVSSGFLTIIPATAF